MITADSDELFMLHRRRHVGRTLPREECRTRRRRAHRSRHRQRRAAWRCASRPDRTLAQQPSRQLDGLADSALSLRAVVVIFAVPPVSHSGPPLNVSSRLAIAVIPARYQSTRLPGKALADIDGRPMIEHVYRRAAAARSVVARHRRDRRSSASPTRCAAFGGDVRMTSPAHQSGTDRLAEVAASLDCDIDRQRPGRRAADRPGDDRRGGRAVRDRPGARDEHAPPADRRRRRAAQSERHEGRRRSRRLRAVFLARADSVHARRLPGRRRRGDTSACTSTAASACCASPRCRRRRSSAPKRSSSCARSSTASASRRSKPPTTRSAWTRRRISSACAR